MRRELFIIGAASLISITVFAQQNDGKVPFPQQMQQDLNRAYQSATSEFNKNYTQPQVESNTGKTPAVTQPMPPQPVVAPQEPPVQQPVNKVPDVAVSQQNNTGPSSSSSSVGNIYAPGGASQDNSSSDTINPYR